MESMLREYLTTMLRNLLAPVIVYAVSAGYITEDAATGFVVAVVAVVVSVVWGLGNKYLWARRVDTALELPANSSPSRLNDVLNDK